MFYSNKKLHSEMDPWIEAADSQTTHMQYGNEIDNVFNKMCLDDNCIWTCVESV